MKQRLLLVGCLWVGVQLGWSQTKPIPCGTMTQDSINRLRYPGRSTIDDFEKAIRQRADEIIKERLAGKIQTTFVTVPVIVHVVHNGETVGTGLNISQAQVQSQIDVINEDYRNLPSSGGPSIWPQASDMQIEFCLAPVDQNGNALAEPGIDRYNGGKASWTKDDIEGTLKPQTYWNPNLFYNVWTVKFGGTDANLLGYAQFPDQSGLAGLNDVGGPASTDGVVVQFSSFGSSSKGNFADMVAPYNLGRTFSHETGHWFGLRHIWGDGNCADDFVSDTPTQQSASSGCPTGRQSCGTTNMIQNYMDYTNDVCMNTFTQGQGARMQAVLQLSPRRGSVVASNLCSPVVAAVPTANFTADKQFVLLGSSVNFVDLSTNFPSSWAWTFAGGDPATSTDRNPRIKYSSPGNYKVTLVATNSLGSSTPLSIDNYITVSDQGLCGTSNNFKAGNTPSFLKLSSYGNYSGYLTGTNSIGTQAVSEFFDNSLGYQYISGVKIQFGHIHAASEDATVTVTVWNARGPQHAPGSIIETKTVLLQQLMDDINAGKPSTIVFDRETPVQNLPYQVGIQLSTTAGDTVAIQSSADGESTTATSWTEDITGTWKPFTIAFGANIAMNIETMVGMDPSVQVSASKPLVYPGEQVTLNGQGASIFIWSSTDGSITSFTGPQLIAYPNKTTTYMTIGSGLTLCNDTTYTTIYVRSTTTGLDDPKLQEGISLYPNPGNEIVNVVIENSDTGEGVINVYSLLGMVVKSPDPLQKTGEKMVKTLDMSALKPGVYLVQVQLGNHTVFRKWVKQ